MSAVPDLGALGRGVPQQVMHGPPEASFYANDMGLSVLDDGQIELRFRFVSDLKTPDGQKVMTVTTRPVVLPPGVLAEVLLKNAKTIMATAALNMTESATALASLFDQPDASNGALTPEQMAERRRAAGG